MRTPFLGVFGRSPIGPLQQHMATVHSAAKGLHPFFNAVLAQDWAQAEVAQIEITELEHHADELKRDLRMHLPKSLFLPVSRSDILELLSTQDNIANLAKDIAGLVLGRRMQIPSKIAQTYLALLERCVDACNQARKAIRELDELLDSGFRGNEVKIVEEMIVKLDEIETDTDEIQIKLRTQLFAIEESLPPIEVMFLYKIIEKTGQLADTADKVGSRLQLLIAR